MERRASRTQGFSLLEVAIAVAIIAILAGAMAPLALKAVNQAREQRTRNDLKAGYEALFGARDRRVSNMRADYGYAGASLVQMTTRGAIRPFAPYAGQPALTGGWNGPYWTGAQNPAGLPLDAWGRPFQLRFIAGGYQLVSLGENGVLDSPGANPQVDDLVYPLPPNPLPVTSVQVNLHKVGGGAPPVATSVLAYTPSTVNAPASTVVAFVSPGLYAAAAVPSGSAVVTVTVPAQPTQSQAVNLAQGGTATLDFYFN